MAPGNVQVVANIGTEAFLSWKPIPCSHQNGKIGHYLVKCEYMLPSGKIVEKNSRVYGGLTGIALHLLLRNTHYSIRVAGANRAGVGIFSTPIALVTAGGGQKIYKKENIKPVRNTVLTLLSQFYISGRPGRVDVTSTHSTSNSVTIQWTPPLDENNLPHEVRLKCTFRIGIRTCITRKACRSRTSWTIEDLPSDAVLHFSLKAVNMRGDEGPSTYVTLRTKNLGEHFTSIIEKL